jgi:hypothetical protein
MAQVEAQGTALFVNPEDAGHAPLPFARGAFQGHHIVFLEKAVLAIQKRRKLVQRSAFI